MCHDTTALAACTDVHRWPHLCADARDWPKTLLSKLSGIAVCLRLGVNVMWLDSDAVILKDPRPLLLPMGGGDPAAELLFSIEADSWNCINAGVFFVRASQLSLRYMALWIALFLVRPFNIDQAVVQMLLGLVWHMNFADFAAREGIVDARSPRSRVLGTLQTPPWGTLDARRAFGMTAQVVTGGIEQGAVGDLAVMHLLESWPNTSIPYAVYGDVPDIVGEMLRSLSGAGRGVPWLLELVRRSENSFLQPRRDCRTSYIHGR
mmetsp:Transcript_34036/g.106181  ORF Transcript_34036/g.106181 Transcript_34036/m.106181 type:complete len:263 (+) Transcript_34036:1-789(+)